MGAKGSAEAAAKLNADNWGHLEVCITERRLKRMLICQSHLIDHEAVFGNYDMI